MDVLILFFSVVVCVLCTAWYLGYRKRKDEFAHLFFPVKTVKIDGMKFVIRKVNLMDYLEGAKVMSEIFAIYRKEKPTVENLETESLNKLKKYLTDIICAASVKPKFVRTKEGKATLLEKDQIPIDEIFNDWALAQKLAQEIFDFTHGKKK